MGTMIDRIPQREPGQAPVHGIFQAPGDHKYTYNATRVRQPPIEKLPAETGGLANILRRTLEKDMDARPCAFQVLQSPWFQMQRTSTNPALFQSNVMSVSHRRDGLQRKFMLS